MGGGGKLVSHRAPLPLAGPLSDVLSNELPNWVPWETISLMELPAEPHFSLPFNLHFFIQISTLRSLPLSQVPLSPQTLCARARIPSPRPRAVPAELERAHTFVHLHMICSPPLCPFPEPRTVACQVPSVGDPSPFYLARSLAGVFLYF